MINRRTLAIGAFGLVLSASALQGQDRLGYREFKLGSDLPSVSALAKVAASEVKTLHQRPAVLQDLEWRPRYIVGGATAPENDPVQVVVFSFYNDQLFRLVIDYDRQRTDGMTDGDMIAAISEVYGSPLKPRPANTTALVSTIERESGTPVARWGDADHTVVLYRSSYASGFRMVVMSPRLAALARTADAQAARLDAREAPQREVAREKKEAEDRRAAQEKARVANKGAFRP